MRHIGGTGSPRKVREGSIGVGVGRERILPEGEGDSTGQHFINYTTHGPHVRLIGQTTPRNEAGAELSD